MKKTSPPSFWGPRSSRLGEALEVVKLTSIDSVVALPEWFYAARSALALTYNPSPIVAAAALYLVLLWPFVRLLSRFEHRMLAVA